MKIEDGRLPINQDAYTYIVSFEAYVSGRERKMNSEPSALKLLLLQRVQAELSAEIEKCRITELVRESSEIL